MKNLLTIALASSVSLAVLSATAAEKVDTSKLPPAADKKDVSFEKDIKPLLEASCLKCHGPEKPKAKYRVDSREAFVKGGDSEEAAVVPGKSADSPVVHMVSDLIEEMEMPPVDKRDNYPAFTKEQIGLLRAWIDQGAK